MFSFKIPKNLKGKRIRTSVKEEIEPQEILLDALSQGGEMLSQKRFEVPLKRKTLQYFPFLLLSLIFLLALKTFQLQAINYEDFFLLSQKNYQKSYFKRPARGVIYDKDLKQLVFNKSSFDLICDKTDLFQEEEISRTLKSISDIIDITPDVLRNIIENSDSDRVLIADDLNHEAVVILDSLTDDLHGFRVEENTKRTYVSGPAFSHIIGFLGRAEDEELERPENYSPFDFIGKSGLEKSYENILRGKKGETLVEKDIFSKETSRGKVSEPYDGDSLILWLDSGLQEKLTQTLEHSLKQSGAKAGAAMAMDPKTGGVLSLVSLPSFDNNLFSQKLSPSEWEEVFNSPLNPFWNRCVSAVYPTGSTIKPLIAAAALEEGIISPERSILCEGKIEVPNPWFPDEPWIFHDWTTHNWVDLRKAIAVSCNVYFYTIGGGHGNIKGLGEEKIKQYLESFGWGHLSGIDIPGEREGLIPDKRWKNQYFEDESQKIWLPGDTYNLSIGQGYLSISPIQVIDSFVAIANGGNLLRPMLVKEIIDKEKNTIKRFEPEVVNKDFADEENLEIVREGMRDAVIYGSSHILEDLPVKVAAKTGTAQTSKKDYYHNWVTVFAPYDDPEIVLTVMIENVPEEQVAALPVAKEVLNWYFTR